MTLTTLTPKKALNKAYLKERINRADMEQFKTHFKLLLDRIAAVDNESEENRKNSVSDFLKSTHYAPSYEINTRGREDLVIHTGKTAKDAVGVLFEIKKPDSSEMMTVAKPNAKAYNNWFSTTSVSALSIKTSTSNTSSRPIFSIGRDRDNRKGFELVDKYSFISKAFCLFKIILQKI